MDGWMDGWMHVFPTFLGDKKMGKHHYDTAIFTPTSPKSFRKYSNFKNRRKEETKLQANSRFQVVHQDASQKMTRFSKNNKHTIRFTFFDASKNQLHPIFFH